MDSMLFSSTNRQAPGVTLAEALLQGQAPDRGLYLPVTIPPFTREDFAAMRGRSYPEVASIVLRKFTAGTFPDDILDAMLPHHRSNRVDGTQYWNVWKKLASMRQFIIGKTRDPDARFSVGL